jgi:hypothetical protein
MAPVPARRKQVLPAGIFTDAVLPHARVRNEGFPGFNCGPSIASAPVRRRMRMRAALKGYPVSLSKKSCARLATYRQCADQHFEKTPAPAQT